MSKHKMKKVVAHPASVLHMRNAVDSFGETKTRSDLMKQSRAAEALWKLVEPGNDYFHPSMLMRFTKAQIEGGPDPIRTNQDGSPLVHPGIPVERRPGPEVKLSFTLFPDDLEYVEKSLEKMYQHEGFQPLWAAGVLEGLDALKKAEEVEVES